MKPLLIVAVTLVLGAIGATVYVGSRVSEPTVVDRPYEHGLNYDRERASSARLGLRAAFDATSLRPGGATLTFGLLDKAGAPVADASVAVALTRPAGGGDQVRGQARSLGGGRYQAAIGFASPGLWDVRLDVTHGADVVGLVQQVRVEADAAGPCDLAAAPCSATADALTVTLDLGRTLVTMKELPLVVDVKRQGAPVAGAAVEVSFAMKTMNMGENREVLKASGPGRYAGVAVLVRCHTGNKDWIATVTVREPGAAPASVQFPLTVRE
jgi:nitrogen fixation protein FixH